MPAHPGISVNDANTIVKYVLSLSEKQTVKSEPVKGVYVIDTATKNNNKGTYIFRAAYRDKGTKVAAPQTSEDVIILRSPVVSVSTIEQFGGVEFAPGRGRAMAIGNGSYLALPSIDLTGINQLEFAASAFGGMGAGKGGVIEVHLNSPTGPLIGATPAITPPQEGTRRGGGGARVKADIKATAGIHNLYFVFVNDKAASTDVLLSVTDIKFNEAQ
jgi:cytochrome c